MPPREPPNGCAIGIEVEATDSSLHWLEWEAGRLDIQAPPVDHVHVNVVLAGRGLFFRTDTLGAREDAFRPGLVNLTLPDPGGGAMACDALRLGVLGMSMKRLRAITGEYMEGAECELERTALHLWDSPLIRAVLLQLGHAAHAGHCNSCLLAHSAGVVGYALARQGQRPVAKLESDTGTLNPGQRRRVLAYVAAHLGHALSVDAMADVAGIGARHFARLFSNSFGLPPYAYVQEQRLLAARQRLHGAAQTVTAVALDCGFASAAAFSSAYRRRFGRSPSAERRGA